METLSKNYSLGNSNQKQSLTKQSQLGVNTNSNSTNYTNNQNINNSCFHDLIICKVKFSAFAEYENICFLPNYFHDLVRIFSQAFYPNDFSVIYLDSQYIQHSIHSDETYIDILEEINNSDEKDINNIKFQIILHNEKEINKEDEDINKEIKGIFKRKENKEKTAQITQKIRSIFENEKRDYIEQAIKRQQIKANNNNNNNNNTASVSNCSSSLGSNSASNMNLINLNYINNQNIQNQLSQMTQGQLISLQENNFKNEENNVNNINNLNNNLIKTGSFCSNISNNNNYYLKSPTSNSCKGFDNKRIDSFKIDQKNFSFIDTYNIESLSDCGNIRKNQKNNLHNRIFKEIRNGKNNSNVNVSNNNTSNTTGNEGNRTGKNYKKNIVQCC